MLRLWKVEWNGNYSEIEGLSCPAALLLALRFFAIHEIIPLYLNLEKVGGAAEMPNDGGDIGDKCECAM